MEQQLAEVAALSLQLGTGLGAGRKRGPLAYPTGLLPGLAFEICERNIGMSACGGR